MGLFNKYVLRLLLQSLLISLSTATALMWIVASIKQMDELSGKGQGIGLLLKMTSLAMPSLILMIMPFAFLITALSVLNKLNSDSELIIMSTSGKSVWHFAKPVLLIACILTIVTYSISLYFQPASLQALRQYIVKVRTDLIAHILQTGEFSSPIKGLTVHIRDKNRAGELIDLLVYDERDPKKRQSYLAETGHIIKSHDKAFLVMHKGHIHSDKPDKHGVRIIGFDQYSFDLSKLNENSSELHYKPRALYLNQLLSPNKQDRYFQSNPGKYRAELHERLSAPLYMLLFAFIALTLMGTPRTVRQKRGTLLLIGILSGFLLRLLGLGMTNINQSYSAYTFGVYAVPLIGIAICFYMMRSNNKLTFRQKRQIQQMVGR